MSFARNYCDEIGLTFHDIDLSIYEQHLSYKKFSKRIKPMIRRKYRNISLSTLKSLIASYHQDYSDQQRSSLNLRSRRSTNQKLYVYSDSESGSEIQQSSIKRRKYNEMSGDEDDFVSLNPKKVTSDKEEVENHDFCDICMQGGEIMLCDSCPRSYHLICILPGFSEPPCGVWNCPTCVGEGRHIKQRKAKDPKKISEIFCRKCRNPNGPLISCESCGYIYHPNCIGITESQVESAMKSWVCKKCSVEPLPGKVERIISRRGIEGSVEDPRMYFVKWFECSYWHCAWVSQDQLEVFHLSMLRSFLRKNEGYSRESSLKKRGNSHWDELIMNGIKPEWLTIQRIISRHDGHYLVKWRDLQYDQCTWEEERSGIVDMDLHVRRFHQHIASIFDGPEMLRAIKRNHVENWSRLHAYQTTGVDWLTYSWKNGTNTILADEMGLGKTIQSIMFLSKIVAEEGATGPFLITVPLSTLVNWEREFEVWAPDLYVITYIGDKKSRGTIKEYEFDCILSDASRSGKKPHYRTKQKRATKFHVLLTSYELICIDQKNLSHYDWKVLIVDEAHRLKNNSSKFFKVLSQYNIQYKVLLTGTPLQNNLKELFHLMNFLQPTKFNDCQGFLLEFADIEKEEQIDKLHKILGSHMLRRLKTDVLSDMPGKSELIVRVDLSPIQKKYCKFILTKNFEALNTRGNHQVSLLNIVMELKKLCNHPYLFHSAYNDAPMMENGAIDGAALIGASGKLELLARMLRQLYEKKHRVLIFSQMTRMLDLLEEFLEYENYKYERLDGGITGSARQEAIDRFNAPNAEQFVFLLSTRAGGLGLNLATADTVVIYDSDWNPHNDIQALSRAHRIGQSNRVLIYRFVTRNSVEERIAQVAKRKMMLTHLVVRSRTGEYGENKSSGMSKKELDDILRFGTEDLFKSDDADDNEKIIWDDEAVSKLLDRQQDTTPDNTPMAINEYLSSFKVAKCVLKADETEYEPVEQTLEDGEYWKKLLGAEYDQHLENSFLGKGKRTRKPIVYPSENQPHSGDEPNGTSDSSDYTAPSSGEESHSASSDDLEENVGHVPLRATVHGQVEIYGLNARQRKAFCTNMLRYGLPTSQQLATWRSHRDLSRKSLKELEKYLDLFSKHICEPNGDPIIEAVNVKQVLIRISTMNIIRCKVEEYAADNGFSFEDYIGNREEVPTSGDAWDFNICDRGFTDLHAMWSNEEKAVTKASRESIWNRKHDFWLLAGIMIHGYGRWQDINNDKRFSIINMPFAGDVGKVNFMEIKNKALARRFRVLEQALVIEDQCNRADQLGLKMSVSDPCLQLYNRIVEFGHIVECNKVIFERADEGNQFCINLLQKVFEHLDRLTNEMKQELSNLPIALSSIPSVSSRLGLTTNEPDMLQIDMSNKFEDAITEST